MMSDPNTIDGTTVDEVTGRLVLLIEENRPWDDADVMHRELAAKVRRYVRYIKSEEFAAEHGRQPKDTCVRLIYGETPSAASLKFFERVGYELSKHRIAFEHEPSDLDQLTAVPPIAAPSKSEPAPAPTETLAPPEAEPPAPADADEEAPVEPAETATDASDQPEEASVSAAVSEPEAPVEPEAGGDIEPAMPIEESPRDTPELTPGVAGRSEGKGTLIDDSVSLLDIIEDEGTLDLEDAEVEFQIEGQEPAAAGFVEPANALDAESSRTPPPFFPEEEFGRAIELEKPEEEEPIAVIETASGEEIALSVPAEPGAFEEEPSSELSEGETQPSLLRALGAASTAALAGALLWGGLALAANRGASPLALVVGLMVGASVRIRGAGHTTLFRIMGTLGTVLGCLLGGVLAAAVVSAHQDGAGITGIITYLSGPGTILNSLNRTYAWSDLVWLVPAVYFGFRISASKAPSS